MAYIVKMTYAYPADKFPPDKTMKFPYSSEIQSLRDEFINQGKILATDSHLSKNSFSRIYTLVFKSENEFNEWSSIVAKFFVERDAFLTAHGIVKSFEYTQVD
jgi:hypothetical protein